MSRPNRPLEQNSNDNVYFSSMKYISYSARNKNPSESVKQIVRSKERISFPQKVAQQIDLHPKAREPLIELTENCKIIMSPERFNQCLRVIRWTPINIASALQCELSWIEAMEAGTENVPADLAEWLETLAQAHEVLPPPLTYRGKRSTI